MLHEPVAQKNLEQNFRTCLIRRGPDYLEGILCIVVLLSHINNVVLKCAKKSRLIRI